VSLRSEWDPSSTRAGGEARLAYEEVRRNPRSDQLAVGTLACSHCDAPIDPGGASRLLTDLLACPFCSHQGPVRDFLTLGAPTRAAHVVVRVRVPAARLGR
jgi:hypothetical protein